MERHLIVLVLVISGTWGCAQGRLTFDFSEAIAGEQVTYLGSSIGSDEVVIGNRTVRGEPVTGGLVFPMPRLLGGYYSVRINGGYGVVTVFGMNHEALLEIPDATQPQITKTFLFKNCGGSSEIEGIVQKISFLRNRYGTSQETLNAFDLDGNENPCNCQLVEVTLSIPRGNFNSVLREFGKISSPEKLLVQPLIVYRTQGHAGWHPDPDGYPVPSQYLVDYDVGRPPTRAIRRVLVAILDTGLDKDARNRLPGTGAILEQMNFEESRSYSGYQDPFDIAQIEQATHGIPLSPRIQGLGHGTPIAYFIRHTAPFADILPIRVCGAGGDQSRCTETSVIRGICYAIKQAENYKIEGKLNLVLNMSLGSYNPSEIMREYINYASTKRGAVIAAAAGNERSRPNEPWLVPMAYDEGTVVFPAGYGVDLPLDPSTINTPSGFPRELIKLGIPGIVGVASLELRSRNVFSPFTPPRHVLADTSVWGAHVSLAAPGRQVWTPNLFMGTLPRNYYSGTSFATAFASGYLAAIRARLLLTPGRIEACITHSNQVSPVDFTAEHKVGRGALSLSIAPRCP